MRIADQIHNAKGRFAEKPKGKIPADWAEVEATFLDPDEKETLRLYSQMMETEDQDSMNLNFVTLVTHLTHMLGTRVAYVTKKAIGRDD